MPITSNKHPHLVGARLRGNTKNTQCNFTAKKFKRKFDRSLLPAPASYYNKQFPGLSIKSKSVKVRCCFHEPDNHPSLLISVVDGHFKCMACGIKGHDVIAFHMQRHHITFPQAVTDLGAWSHE